MNNIEYYATCRMERLFKSVCCLTDELLNATAKEDATFTLKKNVEIEEIKDEYAAIMHAIRQDGLPKQADFGTA